MVLRQSVLTAAELRSAHAKARREIASLDTSIREARSWMRRCDEGVQSVQDDFDANLLTAEETQDAIAHFLFEKGLAATELREFQLRRVTARAALARLR